MTYARTFGVQIAAYFIQKNKTNSLYGDYDFMFSTPGLVEEKKMLLKKQLKLDYSTVSTKVLNRSDFSFKKIFS